MHRKADASLIGDLIYAYGAAGRRTGATGSLARLTLPAADVLDASYNANNQLLTWRGKGYSYTISSFASPPQSRQMRLCAAAHCQSIMIEYLTVTRWIPRVLAGASKFVRTQRLGAPRVLVVSMVLIMAMPIASAQGSSARERALAELGQRLFFDARLSSDGSVSCATCHQPDRGFADGLAVSVGVEKRKGTRNAPSLLDVSRQRFLFWDGRRESLEAQALDPLLNPAEHGMPSAASVVAFLRADPGYLRCIRVAFGARPDTVSAEHAARALAAFQRRLVSGSTPFDRWRGSGGQGELSPAAVRGWQLFDGTAQCARCHAVGGAKPLFSDHGFHSLAVGMAGVERDLPELTRRVSNWHRNGKPIDHEILSDPAIAQLGRFVVTGDPRDLGKFKTPSLRNVSVTAPYMHDGSVPTLKQAIELEVYYRSKDLNRPLILTPAETDDLVAFLETLTSDSHSMSAIVQSMQVRGKHHDACRASKE